MRYFRKTAAANFLPFNNVVEYLPALTKWGNASPESWKRRTHWIKRITAGKMEHNALIEL